MSGFTREAVEAHNAKVKADAERAAYFRAFGYYPPDETSNRPEIPHAKPQRDNAPALDRAAKGEAEGMARTIVRITGYRLKPLDPDNFAAGCKGILDGLRHAHIIIGDEPWRIKLETDQEKVASLAEEETVIEIEYPDL